MTDNIITMLANHALLLYGTILIAGLVLAIVLVALLSRANRLDVDPDPATRSADD